MIMNTRVDSSVITSSGPSESPRAEYGFIVVPIDSSSIGFSEFCHDPAIDSSSSGSSEFLILMCFVRL